MAIEIIRKGKLKYKIECPRCNALLSYTVHDIFGDLICCPCCGGYCQHYNHIKESENEE